MNGILVKAYGAPPIREKEILRYAGVKSVDSQTQNLIDTMLAEVMELLTYKVCYTESELVLSGDLCKFVGFEIKSKSLAKNLTGCRRVIIFAATVGIALDRAIAKYTRLSPARAFILQAIGAERIESLCDRFEEDLSLELGVKLRPRFSVGYGDAPLDAQSDIFRILDASRKIGISLNNSMLMSPTKSVSGFIGIEE